ncbi:MAG: UDP-N-acetylmuramoyl-L-alanine--D-glutamate ligase [Bacilli bacterium]|nr:UDP-N-acetylmuramoyl-L-alanine--D-glutamate ligase [Bacilli bacterium]
MFNGKNIFVLGMGRSGVAVSNLLCEKNHILLTDVKGDDLSLIKQLEEKGINVVITDHQEEVLTSKFDYVVKNPGVRNDHEVVLKAKKLNIPVINEMEVAYNFLPKGVKIVGITGSNGKTTTSYLTYEILSLASLPVHLGGNMGIPLCDMLESIKENDVLVLEISSHQLVNFNKFKTDISVLTNFSEVHLDFFGNYDNYKNNKLRIFNHHTVDDVAILNGSDKAVCEKTKDIVSKKLYFSSSNEADCYIDDGYIYYKEEKVCEISDIRLKGKHNYENVMCAIMVAKEFGVSNSVIKEALAKFSGVEHRMEFVRRLNDREFYNDSKATNNKSTIVALSSFESPVILILGGLDRGQSFDELNGHLDYVKSVVCYGQTKEKIEKYFTDKDIDVTVVDNLEEAVKLAYNLSEENDTILFSPACASWDQFDSFEQRGKLFKEIVENLQ